MPSHEDPAISAAKKAIANARKTLVQQQSECGPADPAALAEMQVKNLDKFAKKLKKQYQEALDQNIEGKKEIKFIDEKLEYLKGKYDVLVDKLAFRQTELARMSSKLAECLAVQDELMHDVKSRVVSNHHASSRAEKKNARETAEVLKGFSIAAGSTCTAEEGMFRSRQLRNIADKRNELVAKMKASGALGATLSDMLKLQNVGGGGGGGVLNLSESMKSLPTLKFQGRGNLAGSASTGAL